jgi:hypothetical protein
MKNKALMLTFLLLPAVAALLASCSGGGGHSSGGVGTTAAVPSSSSQTTPTTPGTPTPPPSGQTDVLMWHNDLAHSGQVLNETTLTPATVNAAHFGKLFTQEVLGQTYAQPLYKSQVTVGGIVHNVVYVATMHDQVYAFDATTQMAALWQVSFLNGGATTVPLSDYPGYTDLLNEIGILSTPVIDPTSSTLYVVAKTKEASAVTTTNPNGHVFRLHALDLATGAEKMGGPVVLAATFPGTGTASVGGVIALDPYLNNQRSALLLLNGVVYVAFSSYGDSGNYHGWILGYDASNLAQVSVWNDTPNNPSSSIGQGGIYMSGGSPASDGTSIYTSTGNGWFDTTAPVTDFGDSVVKLDPTGLTVADYFTPSDQATLNANDLDLDSGGIMILPTQPGSKPDLLVTAGKDGTVYLIDRDNMGAYNATTDQVVQEVGIFPGISSTPAYWNGTIYYKPATTDISVTNPTALSAFPLIPGSGSTPTQINFNPSSSSTQTWGWPGATPSISANGTTGGIVWVIEGDFTIPTGSPQSTAAILRAYDATNLANELYDSTQNAADGMGNAVKFTLPIIANGKVYVCAGALNPTSATSGELSVFGIK